jgi:O-antigen/teichoic acid export membrane protein
LLIIAWTPTIFTRLAPELYRIGVSVVPVILFAYIVYGLSYPLNVGIMIKDQTRFLPLVGWLAAGVCLGLNLWWIPRYGMSGAAWATVAAYAIWTGGIAWVSLRIYPIHYSLHQIGWIVVSVVVGYGGLWVLDRNLATNDGILALALRTSWVLALFLVVGIIIWRNSRLKEAEESIPFDRAISS